MALKEYDTGRAFPGVIGRTTDESSPAWPRPLRAVPGAPNVLMIVLDDTGFGQLGCYGSPIATPNLDGLAAGGLLYTNMHTTALCRRAMCPWPGPSFAEAPGRPWGTPIPAETLTDLDAHHWELYHVAEDPAENHDLAGQHRDTLVELIAMWYVEAGKYNVLPIDGSAFERMMVQRPQIAEPRNQYIYRPGTQTVPYFVGPKTLNRPHSITADTDIPGGGAEGVLLCQGSGVGGWTFYVQDGKLHYAHNWVGRQTYYVSAADPLPAGRHQLRFEFEPTGKPDLTQGHGAPGRAQLYIDGKLAAHAEFPVTTPVAFNPGGLTCGANPGSTVIPDYQAPFRFTGTLHSVTVDLSGDLITDTESEMRMAMARQ